MRSILAISYFIVEYVWNNVSRQQSVDKDRKRTQVIEVMRKRARDGQNHGVEESWRKLKRSHR